MKKLLALFLLMMCSLTICFSQTTLETTTQPTDSCILISIQQLKTANLIFNDHDALLLENDLLSEQLDNMEYVLHNKFEEDSIKDSQISLYEQSLVAEQQLNQNLHKIVKTQQYVAGGSIIVSLLAIILCMIK